MQARRLPEVQSLSALHSQQPPLHAPFGQVVMQLASWQRTLPYIGAWQVLPDDHRPIELQVWGVLPEQPLALGEHSPLQVPFTQARPGQSALSLHWQQPEPHVPLAQVTAQVPPSQRALPYIGAWQALPEAHRPIELQVCGVFPEQPRALGEHSPAQAPATQARPGQSA
jgi:hypothetical protein